MTTFHLMPLHGNILTTLKLIRDNLSQLQALPVDQRQNHLSMRMAHHMLNACTPDMHDDALTLLHAFVTILDTQQESNQFPKLARQVERMLRSA